MSFFFGRGVLRPIASKIKPFNICRNLSQKVFNMQLPTIPSKRISSAGLLLQEKLRATSLKIENELGYSEEERDDSFRLIRVVSVSSQDFLPIIRQGDLSRASAIIEENKRLLTELLSLFGNDSVKRETRLSSHLERVATAHMLVEFFSTGKLASPSSISLCNDEEYIGASIGWAQELSRYALQRAIDGETSSVEIVRCALTELHQLLLTFDFRNGSLRRRYDGMKYFVKSVEDITYELSLLPGCSSSTLFHDTLPSALDRATSSTTDVSPSWQYIDGEAIVAIQQRMAAYDQQRELVIKDARDIQKLSKQAIFSIIRGQNTDAKQKLGTASKIIDRLFAIVNNLPTLRPGSFSNSLEEWCEAQMLLDWCEKKTIPDISDLPHPINAIEYIGGLSDFTGELGRLAVMLAAKRDIDGVQEIMEVDTLIYDCIARVNNLGSNFNKKLDAVQTNAKKVEDLVFELTIMERSGRMKKRMRLTEDGASAPGPSANDD